MENVEGVDHAAVGKPGEIHADGCAAGVAVDEVALHLKQRRICRSVQRVGGNPDAAILNGVVVDVAVGIEDQDSFVKAHSVDGGMSNDDSRGFWRAGAVRRINLDAATQGIGDNHVLYIDVVVNCVVPEIGDDALTEIL